MQEFWQQCVTVLSRDLPVEQVKQWVLPLVPIGFNEARTEFRIAVPSPLKQNWAKTHYTSPIQELIQSFYETEAEVIFQVIPRNKLNSNVTELNPAMGTSASTTVSPPSTTAERAAQALAQLNPVPSQTDSEVVVEIDLNDQSQPSAFPQEIVADGVASVAGSRRITQMRNMPGHSQEFYRHSAINPVQNFDNLVVGPANEFAVSTALRVTKKLAQEGFNPLFMYGGTGLGKTHLMHAIGNKFFEEGLVKQARYIHADAYYSELVRLLRSGEWNDYKLTHYQNLDLLLIDDIQFFRNKPQTQEQFFHLFDLMIARGHQLVISSDTYPNQLENMEQRLISRFSAGMIIQLEPPELEMRVAILFKKAAEHGEVTLTDEAAFFIAKHIRRNVRELEGALQRITAWTVFKGRKTITVEHCKEALKDVIRSTSGLITVDNIQRTVASFYKIRVQEMYSKRRTAQIARARQIAMYLSKELTQQSLPALGDAFGGRDHTTVLHAVRKISDLRNQERDLNHELHVLEQTIKG